MLEILGKLFNGNLTRVKVLRFVLLNTDECFTPEILATNISATKVSVRKEIDLFHKIGLLQKTKCEVEEEKGRGKNKKVSIKKVPGFILDKNFEYIAAFKSFFLDIAPGQAEGLARTVKKVGKVKLVIVAGAFLNDEAGRVDMLVVGDSINMARLEKEVKKMEIEIGRELRIASFLTPDFLYRLEMHDRLLADVFDFPHTVVVDSLKGWRELL